VVELPVDGYPDREVVVELPTVHRTASYSLGMFTDARHDSLHEVRLVRMFLEDTANGIGVTPPPVAGGPPPAP
jgi:hypothetical protein